MPSTLLATPASHTQPTMADTPEENVFRQAWHSIEEALHLRESVPPPVPPKDEKWLVKTVDLALPQDEPDTGFWEKIIQKITSSQSNDDDEQDAVSLNVPAEAALNQLGVQSNDGDIQAKKDYFKRMAARVQEKFEQDKEQPESDSSFLIIPANKDDDAQKEAQQKQQQLQRQQSHLMPKVDPKEMKAAHSIIYHKGKSDSNDDDEDKKLFGSWWGCHSKRSKEDKEADQLLESEWEIIDIPKNKREKRQSLGEHNGASVSEIQLSTDSKFAWWKRQSVDVKGLSLVDKHDQGNDRKATTKRHQAIAAAAAYEAVKEYQARKARQGKKVSHGEMKAVLAGMAMAEAIKILESRHGDSDDDEDRNETVAEAGTAALKLFELLR
ncbi:hypothetical protein BGZ76_007949 [Entomortierella beljakovae]|nr:hypothetical protein BGZ76_007949 [Entomortierella beljakovae]